VIDRLAILLGARQGLGHAAIARDGVAVECAPGFLRQDVMIISIRAGQVAKLDQSSAFEVHQTWIGEKLILGKTIEGGFDECRRLLEQVLTVHCQYASGSRPVVDLDAVVNRLLPFPDLFIARGELGVQTLFGLRAIDAEQFIPQKILKKTVKFVFAVVQMANQRKPAGAQLGHQFFQCVGLKKAGKHALVDGADERCSTKEFLFLRGSRRVKLFGEGIKRFAAGGILSVQMGKPFTQGGAELQQPGRVLLDQVIPVFAAQSP
jgi:hypothetical protein